MFLHDPERDVPRAKFLLANDGPVLGATRLCAFQSVAVSAVKAKYMADGLKSQVLGSGRARLAEVSESSPLTGIFLANPGTTRSRPSISCMRRLGT